MLDARSWVHLMQLESLTLYTQYTPRLALCFQVVVNGGGGGLTVSVDVLLLKTI
jgi:hypothetical protein